MEQRRRADAQRNIGAVLDAAKAVFAESGVDAPVREIAVRAGVGVGTLYRHFPQRSDLIVAVFKHEIDACAAAADDLAQDVAPDEALVRWLYRYAELLGTKRGLAAVLHSGDAAYDALPTYFETQMLPRVRTLLDAASNAGGLRADVEPNDLLHAVACLCMSSDAEQSARMLGLLIDGLRYQAPER
ncbi:TetR family transcriptional regulator [Mycobacterium sp. MS1601]|uniref:TetR/AcrR family transcriptional regulator n=1 Tax=Mycobacterium sp. MS1601 TaxID=1936029 RepID=UPI0009794DD9|nr:TetR/AcrR family transcriptional regulator [Mycobacterium sp. MS1601]AQA01296.1 TetR family transcriptional regulator [Mycobacterium sp. MS1601]